MPLILKKREGGKLSQDEIFGFIQSLTSKSPPPDYQVSALLAFIVAQGMDSEETYFLTDAMKNSGKPFRYSGFPKSAFFVDKHSTGGVGDKITLPLVPLVLACSDRVYYPTIAGRALGHTGGTVDKLESIPGFKCGIETSKFYRLLKKNRGCFLSQTKDIAPADRVLYHLRDVTGTVSSIPLITASILSKKLSESLHYLLIDLKIGSGAFLPRREDCEALSQRMLKVLSRSGVSAEICMTNMDTPLGRYSGNLWEVLESFQILKGEGPQDSTRLTLNFAERQLVATGMSASQAQSLIQSKIKDGSALKMFEALLEAQGAKLKLLDRALKSLSQLKSFTFTAKTAGFVRIDVTSLGLALVEVGAGRKTKADKVDSLVGFEHLAATGDRVESGQPLLKIFYRDSKRLKACLKILESTFQLSSETQSKSPLIAKEYKQ